MRISTEIICAWWISLKKDCLKRAKIWDKFYQLKDLSRQLDTLEKYFELIVNIFHTLDLSDFFSQSFWQITLLKLLVVRIILSPGETNYDWSCFESRIVFVSWSCSRRTYNTILIGERDSLKNNLWDPWQFWLKLFKSVSQKMDR